MGLTIELEVAPDLEIGLWAQLRQLEVSVRDSSYIEFMGLFTLLMNFDRTLPGGEGHIDPSGPWTLNLWKVAVQRPGTLYPMFGFTDFTASVMRDLPVHTWEIAARERVASAMRSAEFRNLVSPRHHTPVSYDVPDMLADPDMIEAAARNLVAGHLEFARDGRPINPDDLAPGQRRSYLAALKLARTAVHYMRLLGEGRHDPAAEIARIFGVAPGTARTWIHRARQQAYLHPSIGPTAGHRPEAKQHSSHEEEQR